VGKYFLWVVCIEDVDALRPPVMTEHEAGVFAAVQASSPGIADTNRVRSAEAVSMSAPLRVNSTGTSSFVETVAALAVGG